MISSVFTPQQDQSADQQEVLSTSPALRPWSTPHVQRLNNAAGGTSKDFFAIEYTTGPEHYGPGAS